MENRIVSPRFQDDSLASGFACSCTQVTEKELSHNSNNFSGHWGGNFCISLLKSKMWGKSWAEMSSRLHFHVLWISKLIEIKNENHLFLQVRFSWSCPLLKGEPSLFSNPHDMVTSIIHTIQKFYFVQFYIRPSETSKTWSRN